MLIDRKPIAVGNGIARNGFIEDRVLTLCGVRQYGKGIWGRIWGRALGACHTRACCPPANAAARPLATAAACLSRAAWNSWRPCAARRVRLSLDAQLLASCR